MGQGTTPPPTPAPAEDAATPDSTAKPGMTPQQMQAVSMLLGQIGKRGPVMPGIQATQASPMPQTSTMQGGVFFNPNKQ